MSTFPVASLLSHSHSPTLLVSNLPSPKMSSITLRRCAVDRKTGKTMYDALVEEARALGDSHLGAHGINSTFFRANPDAKGNIFYEKPDGAPFLASFIAEIGSEAQGTWMAAYPKKSPPAHKLPMNDGNSRSHRMVLALRCPTDAPPELRTMFRNGLATCDGIRAEDEKQEADSGQRFDVTEWIFCAEDAPDEDAVLLLRLYPTYEVPYSNSKDSSPSPRSPRKRFTKVSSTAELDQLPDDIVPDKDIPGPEISERRAELTQRDYTDKDGKLIAPEELYATLTEGTLVLVMLSLATYVITDQKSDKGTPLKDKKIYHVLVDRLKVLDRGDAEPWAPPVPVIPEARTYSPMTPQRRGRDDAADTAFNTFGTKLSPSLTKRPRRSGNGYTSAVRRHPPALFFVGSVPVGVGVVGVVANDDERPFVMAQAR
ncbi:hypothetical protein B0H10DRAFT_2441748 [Mycena sp. CBHHK59/15]|nr:hypothetical protein B0H10DRAFT_2441748 [Mycena sp. CBHHK59/15]